MGASIIGYRRPILYPLAVKPRGRRLDQNGICSHAVSRSVILLFTVSEVPRSFARFNTSSSRFTNIFCRDSSALSNIVPQKL